MKKLILIFSIVLANIQLQASSLEISALINDNFLADDVVGQWLNEEKTMTVQIEKIGRKYYGKLVWLEKPNKPDGSPKLDEFNPDPALRNVPFIGLRILKDMEYKGKGVWGNGTLYDPEHGKYYGCKVTLENQDIAIIRGYIGFSLIGKSVHFDRVKK